MAGPYLFDRVKETSTTTGTGALTLAGAVSGFRAFTAVLSNSDTTYYAVEHQSAAEYEYGIGTFTTSGTTLARTTVLGGSNGTSAVNFSAGTKHVFIAPLATMLGDRNPEISVTGATTATIDRVHVCSGTSADYTVTLPAASGNAGRRLWFRMAPLASLSKRVTLDGNSSETIDGATTRVMWAGETCELLCDGSNWFKVAGKTIPMTCKMKRTTNSSNIANNTVTLVPCPTSVSDPTGAMADTGNGRITILRTGLYAVRASMQIDGSTFGSSEAVIQVNVQKNNSTSSANTLCGMGLENYESGYSSIAADTVESLAATDTVHLAAYHANGTGTVQLYAGNNLTFVEVAEVPAW